jgi:four helix bundle protein
MTKSFEDFEVYQKGIQLAKLIFKLVENKAFEREFGFKNQIKRAVISITNNIVEGSEYNNNRQFIRYLKISKGSCGEVRSMLTLSKELGFCSQTEIEKSYKMSIEISQNLSNFIKYLSTKIKDLLIF